jgi:7-keto-8-aminopelargonate synthetase-like enzyme
MLFSGPIQPPMLGAAVASTKLQLSAQHAVNQAELIRRIDHTLATAARVGLPLATHYRTPIFFVPCDSVEEATDEVQRLLNEGFYVCPSAFPAVPVNCPGVRFTITLHNTLEDIDALIAAASSAVHIGLPRNDGGGLRKGVLSTHANRQIVSH